MSVFKEDKEIKRVIFNIRLDLAERLENAKEEASALGKKLDVEGAINKSLERFLKKAEKKIEEMKARRNDKKPRSSISGNDDKTTVKESERDDEEE